MSINHSPGIVTNGLAFYYDMYNTKSFKGAPTTNVVSGASTFSSWANYWRTDYINTFTTEFGTTGYRISGNPSWNGVYRGITLPSTGTYTFSAWFRYWGGTGNNVGAAVYVSGWGGGDSANYLDKSKVGVWQRVSLTLNCTNTSLTFYIISWGGDSSGRSDCSTWDVTMPQIESGSFATGFVDGTRSSTDVLKDISVNNRTVYPTNLTTTSYTSNYNSIRLNSSSTNQYIYTDGTNYWNAWSPDGSVGNSSLTLEIVFKTNSETDDGYIISRPWNGSGQYNYLMSAGGFYLFIGSNSAYIAFSGVYDGSIQYMTYWMSPSHFGVYRNGKEYVSATAHNLTGGGASAGNNQFGTLVGSLYPYGEGWGGNSGFSVSADIYKFRIYNRVLSAGEILQNFNAQRGLYGV